MSDYDQLAYNLRRPLGVYFLSYEALLDLGRGTAFPTVGSDGGALQAGTRFFRTDLGWAAYYDGTRWLTAHEYVLPIVYFSTISINTDSQNIPIPAATTYDIYITRETFITNVAATNNGSNFWTLIGQALNTANSAATTILTFDTHLDTAATYVVHEGVTTNIPANKTWYRTNAAKTGTPGNLTYAVSLNYRLVLT